MRRLRDLPIRRKLTIAIMATCAIALTLVTATLIGFEAFDARNGMLRNTTAMADVVARNTQAALAFRDPDAARDTLAALESEPQIALACLYDAAAKPFAKYQRLGSNLPIPPSPAADGYRFERGSLTLVRPVILNGKRIGTIHIEAPLTRMYARLRLFAGIGLLALIGAMIVAMSVAPRMQRPISEPLLALTETSRLITERGDFLVRATKAGTDEIGALTDTFNRMLDVIAEREGALRSTNVALVDEISERERAQAKSRAQLAHLELLQRITRAIGERQDLPSIFQVVVRSLESDLPVDFASISLHDTALQRFTVASIGLGSEVFASALAMSHGDSISIDENGLANCLTGQLVYEPDIGSVPFPFSQRMASAGLRSLVLAPLMMEARIFGAMIVARKGDHAFTSSECEFLRQLSEHVALAAHQTQLHEALQQAYDDLRQTQQAIMQQERLKALGEMASGIAHDINNAMFPITLYTAYLLEKETELSDRARGFLSTMRRAAEDVAQTVGRMSEFYRKRETAGERSPVHLNLLVEETIDLTRARWLDIAQQRGAVIDVQSQLESKLPWVMGVESEIREALTNLVFNAVDAMPAGGSLTLRTAATQDTPPRVVVAVSDTGSGMDEETRRRCLEPFFTTKGERGTGLGLAMVYGIAQRHEAEIEIDSAPNAGTTIRMIFDTPESGPLNATTPDVPVLVPPMYILIVDDDPLLLRSLTDILEGDGHKVTAASGGREGILAFQEAVASGRPFELVVTDLGMPYVDGRKVAEVVKSLSLSTPVILLTGWGQRLTVADEIPPHVNIVVNKPPTLRDLRSALARCRRLAVGC